MGYDRVAQSGLQSLLLKLYDALNVPALRRTQAGEWLFERAYLFYKSILEAGPIDQLERYVAPKTWVLDVGANIGVFTIPFSRFVRGGKVVAVEPEPKNFESLTRRVRECAANDVVLSYEGVAAETCGTLRLEINPAHPGDHKIAEQGTAVTAWSLDALLEQHGNPPVSLIKIDVQGAELRVLRGAEGIVQRSRPALLVELDEQALRRQGASIAEVLEWARLRGYVAHEFKGRGNPQPASESKLLATDSYVDVLFLPNRSQLARSDCHVPRD